MRSPWIMATPQLHFSNIMEVNMKIYYTFTYCDSKDQIKVRVTNRSTGCFRVMSRSPIKTVLDIFEELPPAQLAWVSEDKNGAKLSVPGEIVEDFDYKRISNFKLRTFIKELIQRSTCPS